MNKKIIGALIAVLIIAGAIGAAVVLYTPTPTGGEKVTVMMPYLPAMGFSSFYCALDQGYYADEGLNVEILHTQEGSMGSIKQVGANKMEFGMASGDPLIMARSKGTPVVYVYEIEQVNPFLVIALKDSEISKPEDLLGKSVAIPGAGGPQQLITQAILLKSGLDYNNVNFVPMAGQETAALLEHKTDAMAGHIFNLYLLKSMGKGGDLNVIYGRDYANLVGNGVITNEKTLNENPELVRKFVRATDKGFRFAINNPEKAVDIYIKNWAPQYAEKRDFHLGFWKELVNETYQPHNYPPGQMRGEQWTMTQDVLYDLGMIDHKIDLSKAYTTEFVPSGS